MNRLSMLRNAKLLGVTFTERCMEPLFATRKGLGTMPMDFRQRVQLEAALRTPTIRKEVAVV